MKETKHQANLNLYPICVQHDSIVLLFQRDKSVSTSINLLSKSSISWFLAILLLSLYILMFQLCTFHQFAFSLSICAYSYYVSNCWWHEFSLPNFDLLGLILPFKLNQISPWFYVSGVFLGFLWSISIFPFYFNIFTLSTYCNEMPPLLILSLWTWQRNRWAVTSRIICVLPLLVALVLQTIANHFRWFVDIILTLNAALMAHLTCVLQNSQVTESCKTETNNIFKWDSKKHQPVKTDKPVKSIEFLPTFNTIILKVTTQYLITIAGYLLVGKARSN